MFKTKFYYCLAYGRANVVGTFDIYNDIFFSKFKKVIIILLLLIGINVHAQQRVCPTCSGYKGSACTACYGNGFTWVQRYTPYGLQNVRVACNRCGGYGMIACRTCKGYGVIFSTRSNPSFGAKYDCERCLCPRYRRKSTFNSDCKNCSHPQGWHYSQK